MKKAILEDRVEMPARERGYDRRIYLTSPLQKEGTVFLPMIQFGIVADRLDYQGCDTLMFTSKQAVVSAEKIDAGWKRLPSIAIGPATAEQIRRLGGKVLYYPEKFYGESLAADVAEIFRRRQVLYLRPREISFDSRSYLEKEGIVLKEQIIYETLCRRYARDQKPGKGAIIVFTSPSTIHCFIENFGWESDYTAVVIGRTTCRHLPKGCRFVVAETPSIDACIDMAKHLMEKPQSY
jgi:uroporphyrinogen-III synthase